MGHVDLIGAPCRPGLGLVGRQGDAEKGQLVTKPASSGVLQISGEIPPLVFVIVVRAMVGGKSKGPGGEHFGIAFNIIVSKGVNDGIIVGFGRVDGFLINPCPGSTHKNDDGGGQ